MVAGQRWAGEEETLVLLAHAQGAKPAAEVQLATALARATMQPGCWVRVVPRVPRVLLPLPPQGAPAAVQLVDAHCAVQQPFPLRQACARCWQLTSTLPLRWVPLRLQPAAAPPARLPALSHPPAPVRLPAIPSYVCAAR